MNAAPLRSPRAVLFLHLLLAALLAAGSLGRAASGDQPAQDDRYGKLPLYFIENRGQVDERAEYYLHGKDKSIYFTPHGLVFSLSGKAEGERGKGKEEPAEGSEDREAQGAARTGEPGASQRLNARTPERPDLERYLLNLEFVGANPDVRLEGAERTPAVVSYFRGPKRNWKTGLRTYSSVVYRNLWPGIDLEYSGTQDRLKYQFLVHPGADPKQIRLRYHGATDLKVNAAGELEVETPAGGFHDQRPYSYQEVNGKQVEVPTTYSLHPQRLNARTPERLDPCEYGFETGDYDLSRPLVIDPAFLVYAGYIGGANSDNGRDIAVDGSGNAYITGFTASDQTSFPDGDPDMNDMFPITGFDQSLNNPPGPFGGDAFVVKVNPAGTALLYAAYIGGSANDEGNGIAVDGAGNAYVTGFTDSDQTSFPDGDPDLNDMFPVTGFDQTHNGGSDAFVVKVNVAGTALVYATYLGGANDDEGTAIAVDSLGNAYVSGIAASDQTSFPDGDPDVNDMIPAPGFDQTHNGGSDAFVVKVNAAGTALVYAGYIGGDGNELPRVVDTTANQLPDIAVDTTGNAYVTGFAGSNEQTFPDGDPDMNDMFPVPGFDQTFNGSLSDAFVVKVNAAGTALVYATYLGGAQSDTGGGIAVDGAGNAYVVGTTRSDQTSFPDGDPDMNDVMPAPGFDQTFNGPMFDTDAFVAKLDVAGTALFYVTYLGGSGFDDGNGIAVDGSGNAYLVGSTTSSENSFPVLEGPDLTHNGPGFDAFVTKLDMAGTALLYSGFIGGTSPDIVGASKRQASVHPAGVSVEGDDFGRRIAVDAAGSAYVTGNTTSPQATFPNGQGFASLPGLPGPDQTFNSTNMIFFDAFMAKVAQNPPPTVMCPAAVEVTAPSPAGALVMLTAQVSDLDSSLLRVSWTVDGVLRQQQDITITPGSTPTPNNFSFTYSVGMHLVEVSVSDFLNSPVTCPVSVTVNPPANNPPTTPVCPMSQVVTATSAAGAQVVLEVQVADADGNPLTVVWNVDGGAPEATIPVPAGGPPTMATVPFTFQYSLGVHTVDVSVSDGIAPPVACPQIMVTVNPPAEPPPPVNQPPTVVCPANVTVTTRSASGAAVTLQAQVNDADGSPLSVTWNVDGGPVEETDHVPAGGPPTSATVGFTHTYTVGTHQVVITVSDGIAPPVVCPPVSVTVLLTTGGPGHAGGSGGIKTSNGVGVFNFGVVGRLRGRASGALSFKEQAAKANTGPGKTLFDGRSVRIDTATFGGTTGNLTLLVRGQMKTNRYGTVPFQVDALDRGSPGVPRDEFRLTVFADTNRDGIPEPVIFSGNLVTVQGKMNNISLRPNLPPH
jgi:beta-propeller repeat-containing protein